MILSAFNRTTLLLGIATFCTLGGANLVVGVEAKTTPKISCPASPAVPSPAPIEIDPEIGLHGIAIAPASTASAPTQPAAPSAPATNFYNLF